MTTTAPPRTRPIRTAPLRASYPTWPGTLVAFLAYTSLVVVTALWLANRGLQELLSGLGPGLTSAGRLAGLLAADLLLLQVLGMARIPWAERSWGQDRLARWHRWVGFTSFHLMLAHIALITVGYAITTHRRAVPELWTLVATYPGMLLATAGTLLLVLVVVTSVRAARRKLRYESWHLLHLYAYLGVGLALPHQLWNGGEFVAAPAARAYWWSLYVLTLGSVLVFRFGVPAYRSLRHRWWWPRSFPTRPAWCPCTSPAARWTGCRLGPVSSSSGDFSTVPGGVAAIRTRSPLPRIRRCCGSP
ncbi:MAG: ferric reductase-like transmembrane domain-containing protein [Frankiaceae bacterium]